MSKPLFWFLGLVALAVVGSLASRSFFQQVKTIREETQKGTDRDVLDAAHQVGKGNNIAAMHFLDTPKGRMTKLIYDLIQSEQTRQHELEQGLKAIGWDWVMTPDSLRTKGNLEECLKRLSKARELNKAYLADLERAWTDMIARMRAESKQSKEAKQYLEAVKKDANQPGGGLSFSRQISAALSENHDALEESLKFLLARDGRYIVSDNGEVSFDHTVSVSERTQYDGLIQRIDETLSKVGELIKQRDQMAEQRMAKAKELLQKESSRTP